MILPLYIGFDNEVVNGKFVIRVPSSDCSWTTADATH